MGKLNVLAIVFGTFTYNDHWTGMFLHMGYRVTQQGLEIRFYHHIFQLYRWNDFAITS